MIQRFARGAAARRRARRLRKLKQERDEFAGELERQQQHEQEEKRKYAVNRRMHPRTQEDFDLLHEELEAWRVQETRKIKDRGMDSEEELAALQQLLHKETKLLQTIDRLKNVADTENREMHVHATLSRMSEPKSWDLSNGAKVLVHTPFTTRAKQMMQLYFATTLPLVSIEERMDVLLHVKWTAKEYDCELTRQLVNLIDREADLLNRGRNQKTLEGLRKRISNTLLDFIETPEFNPEASRFVIAKEKPDAYIYAHVGSATSLEQTWKKPLYSTI
ncbi:unnamed protein product [Ostreobium quekettii]|uniref:IQ motif and ubiquitin-like domain-containing protein n=1 Tax=Ostreobium quekettii TaxID=121088 RepID=A0A8S1IM49_9CHLO|nr:unnamed protein product [Ostreobium quekettii]